MNEQQFKVKDRGKNVVKNKGQEMENILYKGAPNNYSSIDSSGSQGNILVVLMSIKLEKYV